MTNVITGSLLILTGFCAYAAIHHAFIAFSKPFSRTHYLFSVICLLIVLFEFFHGLTYSAQTLAEFVPRLKWELTCILLMFLVFPWFISEYSNVRPRWLLLGLSWLFGFLFVVNSVMPNTLQYVELHRLDHQIQPWGEIIAQPVGQVGVIFILAAGAVLVAFVFAFYALTRFYRKNRLRTTLAMLLALGLLVVSAIEGILVRAGVIDFIHLGPYGLLAMIIAMSMAISQEMRNKLRNSEQRFRSLVEQSPFSIQVMSPDGTILQVNPAWESLWGVNLEQIVGYNILQDQQLRDKGAMPFIESGFAGQAAEIPPVVYNPAENAVAKGPARDRSVRAYIYPVRDEMEVVREVVLLHEDVTDKKRLDDAIRLLASSVSTDAGEDFFRQLVLSLCQLFGINYAFIGVLNEPNGNVIETIAVCENGALADNFSYGLQGTPCAKVMGQHTCTYSNHVQHQFPQDLLLVEMEVEGYIGTPLFDAKGKALGIIVLLDKHPLQNTEQMSVILEIFAARAAAEIERKHAHELLLKNRNQLQEVVDQRTAELQNVVQELEAFSYSVSHDLRAPLRSIDGFSQALAVDYAQTLDAQALDYLTRIRNSAKRMGSLIDSLLQFSLVTKTEVDHKSINLSALVESSLQKYQRLDSSRKVETHIAKDIISNGDNTLLEVVIDNLISNAWKYTGKIEHAKIEFGVLGQKNTPEFYVKDNGAGFDMSKAVKLFGAFQRFHSMQDFEGNGIGLATVARIIRRHGGEVRAESSPGHGATFYFTLPNAV